MTRRSRSAKPTRKTRRPMRTLKKRSRRVSLFPIGVAGQNAKRKSRKKPAPPCVVSPWSNLVVWAFAFTAAKQPQSAPYLPAPIDTFRSRTTFETILPYCSPGTHRHARRSEEHTSELQSHLNLVCRLLLEKKKEKIQLRHRVIHPNNLQK